MNNLNIKIGSAKYIILSIFALLLFVLNIPGTIALRNILAVVLLIILGLKTFQSEISIKTAFKDKNFKNVVFILISLTIYILVHSVFLADELGWSLSQFRTQWIYPMLYFMMGFFLGFLTLSNKYYRTETLLNVLFFSLFLHIMYVDFFALYDLLTSGRLISRYGGLTESPILANYITNIINSIVIVELIYRFRTKKRVIRVNMTWLIIIFLFGIFSSIVEGMRFGVISLFFMSLTGFIFFVIDNNKFNMKVKLFVSLAIVTLCSIPLLYNIAHDARWLSLVETVPIAIDTETHDLWKGGDHSEIPKLSNGELVSKSNYLRIAWIAKGIEYISNDIFGIGYGRNVFGHAIEKYEGGNEIRGYHSHSSIIDFTIGLGVFGLLIWLLLVFQLIISSAKQFISSGNYFSLLTVFIVSGFFLRSFLDSNMRDHMFKQFFLLLGISLILSVYEKNKKIS